MMNFFSFIFVMKTLDHNPDLRNPDPYWLKMKDPDPGCMEIKRDPQHCFLCSFADPKLLISDPDTDPTCQVITDSNPDPTCRVIT